MGEPLLTAAALSLLSPVPHHFFGHRILLLLLAGLAGMYMVHLLADDYNTYQSYNNGNGNGNRPRPKFLGKRSIPDDVFGLRRNFTPAHSGSSAVIERDIDNDLSQLDLILRFDQSGCARRYVCTIATKSRKKMTNAERNVINMIRGITRRSYKTDLGAAAFREALELGLVTRDPQACTDEYSKCIFNLSQILKLVNYF